MEKHKDITEGKYYQWTTQIYNYFLIEIAFILAVLPSVIGIVFLKSSISNVLVYALFFILAGPALGALVASVETIHTKKMDAPFFSFWRKYKSNYKDSFILTLAFSIVIVILTVDFFYFTETRFEMFRWFFLVLGFLFIMIYEYCLIISMKFSFRLQDILRLGIAYLLTDLITTFKMISYTILLLVFSLYVSSASVPLILIIFVYFLVKDTKLILKEINDKYIVK